ncbi:MAG: hypothetical protein EP344_16490 [Bacteroidetes bacterium]|nr:MAG: hypothetical protein EP344_16490 [Bacteroidota bacterium]
MTQPTGQFPNETYLNGLRDNPESTLAVAYDEFRKPILQELEASGGTEVEGALCFQLAVIDAARMVRANTYPEAVPFAEYLLALSRAHFNQHHLPEEQTSAVGDQQQTAFDLPGTAELLRTRQQVRAWRLLQNLTPDCRQHLLDHGSEEKTAPDSDGAGLEACREAYARVLATPDTINPEVPEWAVVALGDTEGYRIWLRTAALETEWEAGPPLTQESNRIWRWAVGVLVLVAISYGVYQFYFRPKTAAEVFADNFDPPSSLLEDLGDRYGAEMGNDSVTAQPSACVLLLREADAYYQAKEYLAAQDPLLLIVMDSSSICQSDAWYFLGILQIQLEDPTTAIQCFAKIEDLDRYGEDLYWYQALAFVQLAKENPLLRDKARGAVERTLGNTRDPKRREQAETMLKNLSQ